MIMEIIQSRSYVHCYYHSGAQTQWFFNSILVQFWIEPVLEATIRHVFKNNSLELMSCWINSWAYSDHLHKITVSSIPQGLTFSKEAVWCSKLIKFEYLMATVCSSLQNLPLYTNPRFPEPTKLSEEKPFVALTRSAYVKFFKSMLDGWSTCWTFFLFFKRTTAKHNSSKTN